MPNRPEYIRLKRRRDEDSVQTLLLDEEQLKKSKKARYIFKLSKTVGSSDELNKEESITPLLKVAEDHRHFVLEQTRKRTRDDAERSSNENRAPPSTDQDLPPEITQMVDSYLKLHGNEDEATTKKRKPSRKHFSGKAAEVVHLPSLDFVYDVYHLEEVPEDEYKQYKDSNVGFIKIVDKHGDLLPDEESDSDKQFLSDEEDSNDENYYRNDYPEDEDDDRSILFGSEGEEIADLEQEFFEQRDNDEYERPELTDSADIIRPKMANNDTTESYDEVFAKLQGSSNILRSINDSNFIDLDHPYEEEDDGSDGEFEYFEEEEEIPRNQFFPTDKDDPLAIHRDKIFHQLQKMIEKK